LKEASKAMARGDKVRELGTRLDKAHTKLVNALGEIEQELKGLEGILSKELLGRFRSATDDIDGQLDDVQAIYSELDDEAGEIDSQEAEDEAIIERLEADIEKAKGSNDEDGA
jgi:hypothetical protein